MASHGGQQQQRAQRAESMAEHQQQSMMHG
jgi:hypothetical protein